MYPVLLNSVLKDAEAAYHVYCELLVYELCLTDPVWETMALGSITVLHT